MSYCDALPYARGMLYNFSYYDNAHISRLKEQGITPDPFRDGTWNDNAVGVLDLFASGDGVAQFFLGNSSFSAIASMGGGEFVTSWGLQAFIQKHEHDCF
jgi:hypothetical protein